ncbi:MAG: O-antigen ligase family protein [Clostridia bacterium]|nr:O-antigen ligase family protein [Clostridia bacterium]
MVEIVRWTRKREICDAVLKMADVTLGLSVCAYTCKMQYGVFFATVSFFLRVLGCILEDNRTFGGTLNMLWAWFVLTFAVLLYKQNAVHYEPAFAMAYVLSIALLALPKYVRFSLVLRCVYYFSFFIVVGIWLQYLFPSAFTAIAKYYLSPTYLQEVLSRRKSGYVTGFTREVSYSALILVTALGYCAFLRKEKWRYGVCAVLLATLFITGKKSQPVLALLGVAVVVFMLLKQRKHRLMIAGTIVGGFVLVLALFPLWKHLPVLSRLAEFVEGVFTGRDLNGLTNGRMRMYERAIQLWLENLWLGIGWVNFRRMGWVPSDPDTHWFKYFDVHNCYLQTLCETGIIGFVLFMALLVWACVMLVKNFLCDKKDANMHFSIYYFVFFVCYAMVEPSLYTDSYLLLFFMAVAYICKPRNKKECPFKVYKRGKVGPL